MGGPQPRWNITLATQCCSRHRKPRAYIATRSRVWKVIRRKVSMSLLAGSNSANCSVVDVGCTASCSCLALAQFERARAV
eukprot:3868521-Prymnesium_polylepis.1